MPGSFKKFGGLSRNEQLLFSEGLFLQGTVGLVLKVIPFRWIPKLFSNKVHDTRYKVQGAGYMVQGTRSLEPGTLNFELETLPGIKTAIQRASKISPWKNKCLVSSLAARRMLNRRKIPSQLSLGVAKGENGKMIAHAWLRAGDFEVVERTGEFKELYSF